MTVLSRLFGRKRAPKPTEHADPKPGTGLVEPASGEPLAPEAAAPSPQAESVSDPPPVPAPAPAPAEINDDEEDEDEEGALDPAEVGLGSGPPLEISLPTPETVTAARSDAERLALSGPQRITPDDPAGPGSLAEVLAQLEATGKVVSEVVDEPEGFCILYTPVAPPADGLGPPG